MHLSREEFEALVREALDSLPEDFLARLDNVEIVVQDWPDYRQRRRSRAGQRTLLLGLYEGVPLSARGTGYTFAVPDKITLFQQAIEMVADTPEQIREQVRKTVIHEIAHHFGISDARLRELERGR